jgi:phage shock protein PspC (stress-responsive transcriptional regulator)
LAGRRFGGRLVDMEPNQNQNSPRKLYRSRDERVVGGVAGGLGRYFDLDPILFRIGFVALAFLGGAGILLYLAGLLLVPNEAGPDGAPAPAANRSVLAIVGVVALLVVAWPFLIGGGIVVAAVLIPLSALAIAGVLVWWLVSGEGPSGEPRDIALRAALGVGILILSGALAIGGAVAAAAGGSTVVAVILIVAGLALAGGAFFRPVRWLILPALLLGLSAGGVQAAGVSSDGGVGERHYRPASMSDLRDHYELGLGQLDIDLRDLDLPPGDTPLELDLGIGDLRVAVPTDVCVASKVDIGAGQSRVLGRVNDGVDVSYEEHPEAPPSASRLVIDAEIGLGAIEVRDADDVPFGFDGFDRGFDHDFDEASRDDNANAACRADADAG